jgi:hypothetical protein
MNFLFREKFKNFFNFENNDFKNIENNDFSNNSVDDFINFENDEINEEIIDENEIEENDFNMANNSVNGNNSNFIEYEIENNCESNSEKIINFNNFEKMFLFIYLKLSISLVQLSFIFIMFKKFFNTNYNSVQNLVDDYFLKNKIECCYLCSKCKKIKKFNKMKQKKDCENCKDKMIEFFYCPIENFLKKIIIKKNLLDLKFYKNCGNNSDYFKSNFYMKYFFPNEINEVLELYLCYNVDGLQTKKNQKKSIYPYFIRILNVDPKLRKKIKFNHLLALYNKNKNEDVPHDAINYLLTLELLKFEKILKINDIPIRCHLLNILIDLPIIKNLVHFKNYNGVNSCLYCYHPGEIIDGYVRFPIQNCKKRKKKDIFDDIKNKQNGFDGISTPLLKLNNFYINKQISVESMHQLIIGLCSFILKQIHSTESPIYIKIKFRNVINLYFKKIRIPSNYNKKITELQKQKAFQTLLIFLYFHPLFSIDKTAYKFIKNLATILKIIYSDFISEDDKKNLKENIDSFIVNFQITFKKEKMSKNVHNLNHIVKDIENFGSAKFHNNFIFESYNHLLNNQIFTNNNFEKQLLNKFQSEYDFNDELSDEMENLYKKIKKKTRKGVRIKNFTLINGDYIKTQNDKIFKIKFINDDDYVFLKNPDGINDLIIQKTDIKSYMVKTYDYSKFNENPKKIFMDDINLNDLL